MSTINDKNVFGSSSSSSSGEEDVDITHNRVIKQKESILDEGTEIDESIYHYDEVYDDIKQNEKNKNDIDNTSDKLKTESKSKYIGLLLASKQRREKEKLRRINEKHFLEHQRIQEGDETVESFTSESYINYLKSSVSNHNISNKNDHSIKTINVRSSDISEYHLDDKDNDDIKRNDELKKKIDELIKSKITPIEFESYKQRYIQRCNSRAI